MTDEYIKQKGEGFNVNKKKKKGKELEDEPSFSLIQCVKTIFIPLVIIIFFIFTIISLNYMRVQGTMYYNNLSLTKLLNMNGYFNLDDKN